MSLGPSSPAQQANLPAAQNYGLPLVLTPQQEMSIKLEEIFIPSAHAKRREFFSKGGRFAHYTSADAAIAIIETKRLWLRNATAMADFSEVRHGLQLLTNLFNDENAKVVKFIDALDACCPDVGREAIRIFFDRRGHLPYETFIASVSHHVESEDSHGRLSMWRAFGANSPRAALIFRVPFHVEGAELLRCFVSPVSYMDDIALRTEFDQVIARVEANVSFLKSIDKVFVRNSVYQMLLNAVTCTKHAGFHEEEEWRLVYNPFINSSELIESSTETIAGVPQIIHKLPLDASKSEKISGLDFAQIFDRVIIGPTSYGIPLFQAFDSALKKRGVANPKIVLSGIPLRS